jgi:hypothetical protein
MMGLLSVIADTVPADGRRELPSLDLQLAEGYAIQHRSYARRLAGASARYPPPEVLPETGSAGRRDLLAP